MNGAIVDAASAQAPAEQLTVLDPFAGGGIIPLSALQRGHRVVAQDVDPWAVKGLRTMLSLPPAEDLISAREALTAAVKSLCHDAYATHFSTGEPAQISQTFRVMRSACGNCGHRHRLFPFATVTLRRRRDRGGDSAVLACTKGHLFDGVTKGVQICPDCGEDVDPERTYLPQRLVTCPNCQSVENLEKRCLHAPTEWEVVLVERADGKRREIDMPSEFELQQGCESKWRPRRRLGPIGGSVETRVLTRHGFKNWEDLYPRRQRVVLERTLAASRKISTDPAVREAVELAVLGTVEMAGHLSRWDRFYLKAFESMASHRFNFTTLSVEPNVFGVGRVGRGTVLLRLEAFERASRWMAARGLTGASDRATLFCGNSERIPVKAGSIDLILTDPPYHDDVQYADLSLPFRTWAGLAQGRSKRAAVVAPNAATSIKHLRYRRILTGIFHELHRTLKRDGRLVFSYANRDPAAWINLFAALKASGFHPMSYSILQSENDLDPWRSRGRACSLDLLVELSPEPVEPWQRYRAKAELETPEESYLLAIGDAFLATVIAPRGWENEFIEKLKAHPFLRSPRLTAHKEHPAPAE